MKRIITLLLLAALIIPASHAQGRRGRFSYEGSADPFKWRGIGPGNMMGRVSALDALDNNHKVVLVGAASGGVWLSDNGGVTWTPVFDNYGAASIGDVAFFQPDPSIIWVGTGEANNRNSSAWGDGVYKSVDGGKSFTNMGLEETHQVARIATHPSNPDILYVAAVGHLWGYSGERGLFRTTDGGKSWEKLKGGLPDDGVTGCTEIKMHPDNPDILFAAMYHRLRTPWSMYSGGENGGIFKSVDGGNTWKKLTNGLPTGETGRIGISIHTANPDIMVAYVEASDQLPEDMSVPGPGVYRSDDGGETWRYLLRHSSRPMYHGRIEINPINPDLIYVIARQYAFSDDGGRTFKGKPWGAAGGDDHDLWLSPVDINVFYTASDQGAHLTEDGGETFRNFNNMAIGQYYAIGTDMRDPYWVYGGLQDCSNWAIQSNTRDSRGVLAHHTIEIAYGDGFHNQADPTDWRNVYTVCHVGGIGKLNMETGEHKFISPTPATVTNFMKYAYPDYRETLVEYTIDPGEGWLWRDIPDRLIKGSAMPPQFRFNWSTPLVLSPNNPHTLLLGGNHLFRSVDMGESWTIISPDLTTNDPAKRNSSATGGLTREVTGAENHCTIITISESPLDENIIWVGTDDGNVQMTTDGGGKWTNVRDAVPGVPAGTWVSRVEASHFEPGRAYVSFDGHRNDNNTPWIYVTDDYGRSWRRITAGIPEGNAVYVVREDFVNPELLFAGTEFACYVSTNRGAKWDRFMEGMPTVAFHDLVIHPRDADLVAGTHGRSIWILDDITPLQQLNDRVRGSDVWMFSNRVATLWLDRTMGKDQTSFEFRGTNAPRGASVSFWMKQKPAGEVKLLITDQEGRYRKQIAVEAAAGINRVRWNMEFDTPQADIKAFRERLIYASGFIAGLTDKAEEKALAGRIAADLAGAASVAELNGLYKELTFNLGQYAMGRDLFGEMLLPAVKATAGTYNVILEAGGKKYNGTVSLRDDPLLEGKQEGMSF